MTLAEPADSGPHKRPKDGRFGSGGGCETAASGLPCGPPSAFGEEERLPEGRRNALTATPARSQRDASVTRPPPPPASLVTSPQAKRLALIGVGGAFQGPPLTIVGFVLVLLAAIAALDAWWRRLTTEIIVTDKRVIWKRNWVAVKTREINLSKIETVDIRQSIFDRLIGSGTVVMIGTGGSCGRRAHRLSRAIPFHPLEPFDRYRFTHLVVASRRAAAHALFTASITRSRKSCEYGLGIPAGLRPANRLNQNILDLGIPPPI